MASPAQIAANRLNAVRSTGPSSIAGKAVSRFNSLKTGIQAKSQVIPGEDPAELEALAEDYHRQFQPSTPLERFLVDSLIDADWLLRRYRKVEARLWTHALGPEADSAALGEAFAREQEAISRLHRRIQSVERSYHRSLRELQLLQTPAPESAELLVPPPPSVELASFSEIREVEAPPCPSPASGPPDAEKALRL